MISPNLIQPMIKIVKADGTPSAEHHAALAAILREMIEQSKRLADHDARLAALEP